MCIPRSLVDWIPVSHLRGVGSIPAVGTSNFIFFLFLDNFFQSAGGKLAEILKQKCKSNNDQNASKMSFSFGKKKIFRRTASITWVRTLILKYLPPNLNTIIYIFVSPLKLIATLIITYIFSGLL